MQSISYSRVGFKIMLFIATRKFPNENIPKIFIKTRTKSHKLCLKETTFSQKSDEKDDERHIRSRHLYH